MSRSLASPPPPSLSVAVAWAALACASFGSSVFIVSLLNQYDDSVMSKASEFAPWYKMGLMWFTFAVSCVPSLMKMLYTDEPWFSVRVTRKQQVVGILVGAAGGLLTCAALACTYYAFEYDPVNTGPLSALLTTSDVVLYAIVGHFLFTNEQLVPRQWSSLVLLMLGLSCIAFADSEALAEEFGENDALLANVALYLHSKPILAIMYAIGAAILFLAKTIAIKVGELIKLTALASFVLRTGTMAITGLIIVVRFHQKHQLGFAFFLETCEFYHFFPIVCGLFDMLGNYALGMAFMHPRSTIMMAIIGSNPVVVLFLAMGIGGMFPSLQALLGMALAMSSCFALVFLTEDKTAKSDAPPESSSPRGEYGTF